MKKKILFIAIILVLVGINFILRYVHIKGIEDTIGIVSNKLSENGLKLSYEKIRYDNFIFWKVDGQLVKPILLQEKHGHSDKSSFEYIAFSSGLIDKKITIDLSNKINTLISDNDGEHQYISTFSTNPQIDIKFNEYFTTHNEFLKQNGLGKYFAKHIDYLYYHSSGHKAVKVNKDTNTDELIYTIGDFDVRIQNQKTEEYGDCAIKINLSKSKYYKTSFGEDYFGSLAEIGEANYILDANLLFGFKDESKIALNDTITLDNVKPTHKLKINTLDLLTEVYNLNIKGNVVMSRAKILPYFDINVKVVNFDNMLEFYTKLYNILISKADMMKVLSLPSITEGQKKAILTLFAKIAQKSDDNSYSVNITQLKEEPIKFGEYSVGQVIEMYNLEKKD